MQKSRYGRVLVHGRSAMDFLEGETVRSDIPCLFTLSLWYAILPSSGAPSSMIELAHGHHRHGGNYKPPQWWKHLVMMTTFSLGILYVSIALAMISSDRPLE